MSSRHWLLHVSEPKMRDLRWGSSLARTSVATIALGFVIDDEALATYAVTDANFPYLQVLGRLMVPTGTRGRLSGAFVGLCNFSAII